jgi:hypothetical protein
MENFTMKHSKQILFATTLLASSLSQALVIDFANMANTTPGESAWQPLVVNIGGANMTINGYKNNALAYAYLDAKTGGLGVCGNALSTGATNSTANQCNPSSDDNVTVGEYLTFSFDKNVLIDKLWFNNNHDGGFGLGKSIDIDGVATFVTEATKGNGVGSWGVLAGEEFVISYHGCANQPLSITSVPTDCGGTQFYVEKMDVSVSQGTPVPEPASLALLGIGFASLGFMRRRLN